MPAVLVVDDDSHDLGAAADYLKSISDLVIRTASNGLEALEQLADQPAMLVVTDLHMPKMDGLQLLQKIRESHPLSPVIVMTGHGSEDDAARALNHGAAGYVP